VGCSFNASQEHYVLIAHRMATLNAASYPRVFYLLFEMLMAIDTPFWRYRKCLLLCVKDVFHPHCKDLFARLYPLALVHSNSVLLKLSLFQPLGLY